MKLQSKRIATLFFAFILLVAGICSTFVMMQGRTVFAEEQKKAIYYYCDCYPSISIKKLQEEFPSCDIYIYYMDDMDEFEDKVYGDYFDDIYHSYDVRIVILDIKTALLDSSVLYDFFENMKEDPNCYTVFISGFGKSNFYDTGFLIYVDQFVFDEGYSRLDRFMCEAFNQLYGDFNRPKEEMVFLFDTSAIAIENCFGADMDALCQESAFFKLFFEYLLDSSGVENYSSYQQAAEELKAKKIKLLVCTQEREFTDIISWEIYRYTNYNQFVKDTEAQGLCAFGFLSFERSFYDLLFYMQKVEYEYFPIYFFGAGGYFNDPLGLFVITDESLDRLNEVTDLIEEEFYEWIHEIFGYEEPIEPVEPVEPVEPTYPFE